MQLPPYYGRSNTSASAGAPCPASSIARSSESAAPSPADRTYPFHGDLTARDLDPAAATRRQRMAEPLVAAEERRVDAGVLMDRSRPVGSVGRGDERQAPASRRLGYDLLLVRGRVPGPVRDDPYLEEVDRPLLRAVELAVLDAGPRAHPLHLARPQDAAASGRVPVGELTLEHPRQDLHVAVSMPSEPFPRLHAILVDDAELAPAHVLRVVVAREREGVPRVEPAVVEVPARVCLPNGDHPASSGMERNGGAAPVDAIPVAGGVRRARSAVRRTHAPTLAPDLRARGSLLCWRRLPARTDPSTFFTVPLALSENAGPLLLRSSKPSSCTVPHTGAVPEK